MPGDRLLILPRQLVILYHITNLRVTVGDKNVLQTTMFYTFEHFMQQVSRAESLTSSYFGITTGLFGQN